MEKANMLQCNSYNENIRIQELIKVSAPIYLLNEFSCTSSSLELVFNTRRSLRRIIHGLEDRLIVIIGPCSIHDPIAAIEYAKLLVEQRNKHILDLEIIMRLYFEKPRTTIGWKGLINDPYLDNSFMINDGLRIARKLLVEINTLGVPAGTEYLDTIVSQYISDLISWGAIGARTTESQIHRELASSFSCPIGFKNGTDGNINIALDAIKTASQTHHFLSVTKSGCPSIVSTLGNKDCHIILRGGKQPNYNSSNVEIICQNILSTGLSSYLMIDASHANCEKKYKNQISVVNNISKQIIKGNKHIIGVMIESNLKSGRQNIEDKPLTYGQSITDACIGWQDSMLLLDVLSDAVQKRRLSQKK